jgi:microcystin-dependent protein
MSCTGCFDDCFDVTSDKCVKYTGNDIAFLGIENGMPLAEVEEKITDYLGTVLNGTGILPTLPEGICTLVSDLLPASGDITLNHVITALIGATCSLQTQVTGISEDVAVIEANYIIGSCLSGVVPTSGTHDVLQSVIVQLCTVSSYVTVLQNAIVTYVKKSEINDYISTYLTTNSTATKVYTKMVPYTAVEFYGDLTGKFDVTGAGIGDWEQVYLCNGAHGTPDKRGVFPIGVTSMGNPYYGGPIAYALGDTGGTSSVTLYTSNLPAHNHNVTVNLDEPNHFHYTFNSDVWPDVNGAVASTTYPTFRSSFGNNNNYNIMGTANVASLGKTSPSKTGIVVSSVVVSHTGNNVAHENRPPYLACYYIMHIPN